MIDLGDVSRLSKEALALLIVLRSYEAAHRDTGRCAVTSEELGRVANVGTVAVEMFLHELLAKGFITEHADNLKKFQCGDVEFTYAKKANAERQKADLERELLDLKTTLATHQNASGLRTLLNGDTQLIVGEIEDGLGRGLLVSEGFFLGYLIAQYGPTRVQAAYRRCQNYTNPVKGMVAIFKNGGYGKGAKQKTEKKVEYKEFDVNDL